jgi:hypothetical protein
MTPLGPAEWTYSEHDGRPTLYPSIGNWQLPCRSHYFITAGQIHWAAQWSEHQVDAGRQADEQRRRAHYASRNTNPRFWTRLWQWFRKIFHR